jgi:hypothetical protein
MDNINLGSLISAAGAAPLLLAAWYAAFNPSYGMYAGYEYHALVCLVFFFVGLAVIQHD